MTNTNSFFSSLNSKNLIYKPFLENITILFLRLAYMGKNLY